MLKTCFLLLLFVLAHFVTRCGTLSNIDSDSANYDQMYDALVAEYEQGLISTTTEETFSEDSLIEEDSGSTNIVVQKSPWQTYLDTTHRLKCDNPWFWNTIRCVWLDYKFKNVTARTISNRKVALILIGIISLFVIFPICSFLIMLAYFKAKVKKFSMMIQQYMDEYLPGSIVLPNGERKSYDPTPEEEEAFENLIETLTSVV